ncbi:hypothetical protein B0H14DRAFT_3442001 [Mycena olivaceomarginata]|nr:hypothetical protein B0H14DRAFT_3442001 [Mycena olivaceomarginata]
MPRTRHRDVHPSSPRPHPESEWNGDHVPPSQRPTRTAAAAATSNPRRPLRARVAVGDLAGPSFTVGAVIKLRGSGGNVRCTPRSHALACAKPHTTGLPRCGGDVEPA